MKNTGRWAKGGQRYTAEDALAIYHKYHEHRGWRHGTRVTIRTLDERRAAIRRFLGGARHLMPVQRAAGDKIILYQLAEA